MKRLKQKNHIIISIDEKIIFDGSHYPFIILEKLEVIFFNLIKDSYQAPRINIKNHGEMLKHSLYCKIKNSIYH